MLGQDREILVCSRSDPAPPGGVEKLPASGPGDAGPPTAFRVWGSRAEGSPIRRETLSFVIESDPKSELAVAYAELC